MNISSRCCGFLHHTQKIDQGHRWAIQVGCVKSWHELRKLLFSISAYRSIIQTLAQADFYLPVIHHMSFTALSVQCATDVWINACTACYLESFCKSTSALRSFIVYSCRYIVILCFWFSPDRAFLELTLANIVPRIDGLVVFMIFLLVVVITSLNMQNQNPEPDAVFAHQFHYYFSAAKEYNQLLLFWALPSTFSRINACFY